ncbi:tRNA modification GTPase MnmE [Clostridia bacterium]|nr:tRNA modification GTPase MnmE [Clostridia bacterium]
MMMKHDLIVAVATALSPAAVSVIRLSGKGAALAAGKIFQAYSGVPVPALPPRVLTAGKIESGCARDEALCVLFPEGHSFTGEESAEFHCHGGVALTLAVVEELKKHGARQAEAGEFTKRAFLNGKLDLTKAEGIADLIEAECDAELRAGGHLLAGALKKFCAEKLNLLTEILAECDAATDYPDEYDGENLRSRTAAALREILKETETLLSSYNTGRLIKDGVQCVITGEANVGKSSLLNALTKTERAIVTDAPGTTRDLLTETIVYKGFKIHLTDTAGLREAESLPEKIGIERAQKAAAGADAVLEVFDSGQRSVVNGQLKGTENREQVMDNGQLKEQNRNRALCIVHCALKNHIRVHNKSDLLSDKEKSELRRSPFSALDSVIVSAKTGENLDKLLDMILEKAAVTDFTGGLILTTVRQRDAVKRAADALTRASADLIGSSVPLDVAYTDIKDAWTAFGAVTGVATPETIIDTLFSRFCVGK